MTVHRGPASLRPRCTRGGSPVAATPIYHLPALRKNLLLSPHFFSSQTLLIIVSRGLPQLFGAGARVVIFHQPPFFFKKFVTYRVECLELNL
jgi:hypothetical protein